MVILQYFERGEVSLCFLWKKIMAANSSSGACPKPMVATSNGVFQDDNPLDFALPLAIIQICLVVLLTRGLAALLKPLRQPRVIAEIIVSIFVIIIVMRFTLLKSLNCLRNGGRGSFFS